MQKGEKRKHNRVNTKNLSYICLDEDQRAVKQGMGRSLNISESGILLETHFPIDSAHTVILSIGLKNDLADIKGRPVHIRSASQGVYEVGIEFLEMDDASRRTLKRYLQATQDPEN
ncbi:MAG: PilZ domain-containing protein [Desulfobacterales bacterium]|jgi:c-di-GMP-binding flagellar brake protein YcgR|nr:PilZ domain-containing protein [Desulfobacterales bacterium]